MGKLADSRFLSSIIFTVTSLVVGTFDLITKKDSFAPFTIGVLSFVYFIYLLQKTKDEVNER